jgi:hypothetical protein
MGEVAIMAGLTAATSTGVKAIFVGAFLDNGTAGAPEMSMD